MDKGHKQPARRNPFAQATRKLGQHVKPSGKTYKRQDKHRNRRRKDGGFDVLETCLSLAEVRQHHHVG